MSGISAQGSTLHINTGTVGVPVWTKINGLQSFVTPDGETPELEVTDLDSTKKEFIAGLGDEGSFSFEAKELSADPGQVALLAAKDAGEVTALKVTLSNAVVLTFDVIIKSMPVTVGVNGVLMTKVNTKVTGEVVRT